MKKGYKYTIIFMMLVAAIFTFILASAYGMFTPKIKENQSLFQRRSVMYAFNLPTDVSDDEVNRTFDEKIKVENQNGIEAYKLVDNNEVKGYAFPFEGSALWGTVKGYLALEPNLKKIMGISFTEQNETPGLGGRIDESPFKEQWRGVVIPDTKLAYGKIGDKEVDAISGATLTSNSVMRILNDLKTNVISKWRVN